MSRTAKQSESGMTFETDVITGEALSAMVRCAKVSESRDALARLETFLHSDERDRVCLLYGLLGTGKKTLMLQAVGRMTPEDFRRTAYVKVRRTDTMVAMERDLKKLFGAGFRFLFVDEVTLIEDFIDSAFVYAHRADPDAKLYLNDYGVEMQGSAKTQAYYNLARRLQKSGIPIDGVGLQCHLTVGELDSAKFDNNVKRYASLGLTCIVTELDMSIPDLGAADAYE